MDDMTGYYVRCGFGRDAEHGPDFCTRTVFFEAADDTAMCECGAVNTLAGAVLEYKTGAVKIVQTDGTQPLDIILSGLARQGWVLDNMHTQIEHGAVMSHVVVVYVMRRLVADVLYVEDESG